MAVNIYRISREYMWWKVDSENDLSEATAQVACLADPSALPSEEDWIEASIIPPGDEIFGDGTNWWVQILIGPGGQIDLSEETSYPADFQTWIRITDVTEAPVRRPGVITVM